MSAFLAQFEHAVIIILVQIAESFQHLWHALEAWYVVWTYDTLSGSCITVYFHIMFVFVMHIHSERS